MQIYQDGNVSLAPLHGKTVAIIGYGNQGKPQALNLRDSGVPVVIGVRPGSAKADAAKAEGMAVMSVAEAVANSEVVMLLLPDEVMGQVYRDTIAPALQPGAYLGFSHGMAIHAGWVQPDPRINVFLVAPKAQGRGVRNRYVAGSGVPALIAVHQDPAGDTLDVALAYGKAIGCSRAGLLMTTFEQETVSDLFSEQAVLCGGLTELIKNAFEVLVEAGFDPEVAYFECLYEVKLIADLLQEGGIDFMRHKISSTALFGDVTQGENVIDSHVKHNMQLVLDRIRQGAFARAFQEEVSRGRPVIGERLAQDYHHQIEQTGRRLRSLGVL